MNATLPTREPSTEEVIALLAEIIELLLGAPTIAPMLDQLSWKGREDLTAFATWRTTGRIPA